MLISTITQKGQITIPKKIREALKLKTNDRVVFVQRRGTIYIKPVKDIIDLQGIVSVDETQKFTDIRKLTKKKVAERIANE
jgi:AbrB family looped-hinge helix DNA binding protein